jgi:hypothetical protein
MQGRTGEMEDFYRYLALSAFDMARLVAEYNPRRRGKL